MAQQRRALLLPLLLLPHVAVMGFHEGDFIHTSKRSQYQQVRRAQRPTLHSWVEQSAG